MKVLDELRSIVPNRRLSMNEGYVLAERQATALLRRQGVYAAPVPATTISRLPFMRVAVRTPMSTSGATDWRKPRWVVLLNGMEPAVRQRFSLAHEFKHIIDHPYVEKAYGHAASERHPSIERLCDYFAACLLMPRQWIKQAFADGVQDIYDLASLFEVSPQAMQVRLLQLGLIDPYARCGGMNNAYLRQLPASSLGQVA